MAFPTTNVNPQNRTQQPTTQPSAQQTTTPQGVGSTPSTMASAQPQTAADSGGFCSSICGWVDSIIECIRSCLAKIPLIGYCFEKTNQNNQTNNNGQTGTAMSAADLDHCNNINNAFTAAAQATGQARKKLLEGALDHFTQIQGPNAKWQAINYVFGVCEALNNASGLNIAKTFYAKLPENMKNDFKHEIYEENGGDADHGSLYPKTNGQDHGHNFGEFMVANHLLSDVVLQAAANLAAN